MNDQTTSKAGVQVKSILLSELFTMNLAIPEYQRPYKWGEKEISKLLNQLKTHDERTFPKPDFYLGSIILHEDENNNYNIIDGQQRVTTLSIIGAINQINGSFFSLTYNNPVSISTIHKNYDFLKTKAELIGKIDFSKINVTVVVTKSQDDAYNFFETLNTGGVRLTGVQILKAHHLRRVPTEKINQYAVAWEKEEAYLDDVVKRMMYLRRWDVLNFRFLPNFKHFDDFSWKEYIIEEFSEQTGKANFLDLGFSWHINESNTLKLSISKYSPRQPLNDGENFINFILENANTYKILFEKIPSHFPDDYKNLLNKIVNVNDNPGLKYMKYLFQVSLLGYSLKWGTKNLLKFSLYIFRCVYSIRLFNDNSILDTTVKNFATEQKLLDRILYSTSETQILNWLENDYKYKPTSPKWESRFVKGRFINRVLYTYNLTGATPDNYDLLLKEKFLNILNSK